MVNTDINYGGDMLVRNQTEAVRREWEREIGRGARNETPVPERGTAAHMAWNRGRSYYLAGFNGLDFEGPLFSPEYMAWNRGLVDRLLGPVFRSMAENPVANAVARVTGIL